MPKLSVELHSRHDLIYDISRFWIVAEIQKITTLQDFLKIFEMLFKLEILMILKYK